MQLTNHNKRGKKIKKIKKIKQLYNMVKITNTRIKKQRKDFQKPTESELSHDDNTEDVFCS